ncbi:PTS sugar transporter subunit IIA [Rhizobium sp. 2MFCol3.1]|uniref:PTS sugar transporter subunit IIA n=1 Tax=Rhizobium sp. 2MFCol3.1 TaxID=1246459 RepID=UPI00036344A4|nr:PTS sugar transporter subunit IIA [Rhizobium sp. 2MFCol3.1]
MNLATIFLPDDVLFDVSQQNKSNVLRFAATRASQTLGVDAAALLAVLEARELLGSTGIGRGIAVPHAAVSNLGPPRGFILKLARPLDFDAIDEQPVDLVFLLVFGEQWRSEYLKVLATIARKVHHSAVLDAMRSAASADDLYRRFAGAEPSAVAR